MGQKAVLGVGGTPGVSADLYYRLPHSEALLGRQVP